MSQRINNGILVQEIRIKDKALAETTALLVMRKKLNAIFGEEDEV